MKLEFQFDAQRHEYRVRGRVVPSVSKIARRFSNAYDASEWHMARGAMIHKAMALAIHGRLDRASLDPRIVGFVDAGCAALRDVGCWTAQGACGCCPCVISSEEASASRLGFAGTHDLVLEREGHLEMWDWKSSVDASVEIQLGGYAELWLENETRLLKKLVSVELHENGTYSREEYDPTMARRIFMAAFTVYGWQRSRGIIK